MTDLEKEVYAALFRICEKLSRHGINSEDDKDLADDSFEIARKALNSYKEML